MSLQEIKYLLNDAGHNLEFIQKSYETSLDQPEVSIALRLKIKHFLEDVKSSLDYMAYYIFTNYCEKDLPPKVVKEKLKRLYFPLRGEQKTFDLYIKDYYPKLKDKNQDIVDSFESVQPFNGTEWLRNLNELVNKNKHRHLTKQRREEPKAHVHSMVTSNGTQLIDCVASNSGRHNFVVDGVPVTSLNAKDHPHVNDLNATFYIDFQFKDLNLSVLPTLKDIYSGANSIISNLEKKL